MVNLNVTYLCKTAEEFDAMYAKYGNSVCQVAQPTAQAVNGIARTSAPMPLNGMSTEERRLRDKWENEMGKNFRFKKNMKSRFASPLDALRAWEAGEFSRDDMATNDSEDAPAAPYVGPKDDGESEVF